MGREGVWQVPRGRGVTHHIGVEGRVGGVRPSHGQALAFVFHPAVLEPHLRRRHSGSNINLSPPSEQQQQQEQTSAFTRGLGMLNQVFSFMKQLKQNSVWFK